MAQSAAQKKAAAEKRAAEKAEKEAAAQAAAEQPAVPPAPEPVATAPQAEASPIATTKDLDQTRLPESGPSDTSEGVKLEHEDGSRVTVPERMVPAMAAQGFHPAK